MRNILVLGTTAVVLAFGAPSAYAMGGGGNLSPEQSPYAILEPQTLGQSAPPPEVTEASPARAVVHNPAKKRVRTHPQ